MKCQVEGCENDDAEPYRLEILGESPVTSHYCMHHAAINGYCPVCGIFWQGNEFFEREHWCKQCAHDLMEEPDIPDEECCA